MKKIIANIIIAALIFTIGWLVGYRTTILNMSIETDGDGDSAIVTVWNRSDLFYINGYGEE